MKVLRVRDWEIHFENNRTKEIRSLSWVPFPNKHDGEGYTELVSEHTNGPAHYGAWCVICQVASKVRPRGTLLRDDGTPHTARSLALKTRFPPALIDEAIPRLLAIGWLEVVEMEGRTINDLPLFQQPGATLSQDDAARARAQEGNRTEGNGTEQKEKPTRRWTARRVLEELPLPEAFSGNGFRTAWTEWVEYRFQLGGVKAWEKMFRAQLWDLSLHDEKTAEAMLQQSIRNGWKGIFELKNGGANGIGSPADSRRAGRRAQEFSDTTTRIRSL